VRESDQAAIGDDLVFSDETCRPPFHQLRYSWRPGWNGTNVSVFVDNKKVLNCALANEETAGDQAWQRLERTCRHFQNGWQDLVDDPRNSMVDFDDPRNPPYYFKRGCPDLITPGVKIARRFRCRFGDTDLPAVASEPGPTHREVSLPASRCRGGVNFAK